MSTRIEKCQGRLTVYFEDPFWVGVFERIENGKLSAAKVTFGAEPKDYEVQEFINKHYYHLQFSPAIKTDIKDIKKNKILVYDLYKSDERQMLYAFIEITYVTYFISKEGKIVRGSEKPIKERFDVTYTKKYSSEDVIKCPNCGNSVLGSTCSYCRTNLRNQDFKIDSIKRNIYGEE